jgi:hypothetical protein
MKPYESEPLPQGHPLWKETIELGFNIDPNLVANGYKTLIQDLGYMAKDLDGIVQDMTKNPMDVAQNPKPYLKDIQAIQDALEKTKRQRQALCNPKGIHPLGFYGSLSNPDILRQVGYLMELNQWMAIDLEPLAKRYEAAYIHVGKNLKICELLLNPLSPLIASTRGKILIPGEELVKVFEKDGTGKE